MCSTLIAALGNDRNELVGKFVAVNEFHGSNANFILTSLMIDFLKKGQGLCLVSLHNLVGHYHHIMTKMSNINLLDLRDNDKIETVEILRECHEHMNCNVECHHNLWCNMDTFSVERLFLLIKSKITKLLATYSSAYIVIDDISHLLELGVPLRDVITFIHYCRTLLTLCANVSLIILNHVVHDDETSLLATNMMHVADVVVNVTVLKTGHSSDVSGVMEIRDKESENGLILPQDKTNVYHFKLLDRQVKLYAPGTSMLRT